MITATTSYPKQFAISRHYDAMAELDRDVHEDADLAATEVDLALELVGAPKRVSLPCCGMGRHIPRLLERGVQRIVGVDLSSACLAKARQRFETDRRVILIEADLASWQARDPVDAVFLLGNSFGDLIDPAALLRVTRGMLLPLERGGRVVMDYIGEGYLDRAGISTTWQATFKGQSVHDCRTPHYDPKNRVMTIAVEATRASDGTLLWQGAYQKRILSVPEVRDHFEVCGVRMEPCGKAADRNPYYRRHASELGMLPRSTWWVGTKL